MESPIDHVSPFHWPSFTATLPASPLATSAAAYRPGRCAPLNDGRLAADMLRRMAASHRFFCENSSGWARPNRNTMSHLWSYS